MFSPSKKIVETSTTRRLRQACDACHRAKTKCCGGRPCTGCQRSGNPCVYSQSNRVGRPKGTRNKKSLDISLKQQQSEKSRQASPDQSTQWQSSSNYDSETSLPEVASSMTSNDGSRPRLSSASSVSSTASLPVPMQDFSQPSTSTSMTFDFEPDTTFSTYPNVFLGPTPAFSNFQFPIMTTDMSMDPLGMDFHSDPSLGDLQYNFGMPTSTDFGTADFSWNLPVTALPLLDDPVHENLDSSSLSHDTRSSSSEEPPSTMMPPATLPYRGRAIKKARTLPVTPGLTIPDETSVVSLYSPLKTPISVAATEDSKCHCLHHHAKLLVQLQDLWKGLAPAPIDVVLNGVQQALKSWDHYIQCQICQLDDEQEVLLLSAMSIRNVLRLLQNTLPRMHCKTPRREKQQQSDKHASGHTKFSVGSFELKGEERLLVLELVMSQILTKIQTVLACLKTKFSRYPEKSFQGRQDIDGLSNFDYLENLLQGLERSVHLLSTDLVNQRQ